MKKQAVEFIDGRASGVDVHFQPVVGKTGRRVNSAYFSNWQIPISHLTVLSRFAQLSYLKQGGYLDEKQAPLDIVSYFSHFNYRLPAGR